MINSKKNFAIYLPSYNAARTLPGVLDRIPANLKQSAKYLLVVDNCSSDDTEKTVLEYKERHGLNNLHILRVPKNLGYGGSQKIAYRFCLENLVDVVAMVHADGQYAPEVLDDLMTSIFSDKADLTFGSRIKGNPLKGGMPIHRFLGNRALTTLQNLFLGSRLSEFHSGYRIFSADSLRRVAFENLSDDYHFDTEMIILYLREKLRIEEKVIPTHYGDEENYVNIWKYGVQVLVTTGTYCLHRWGLRRSRNWARILAGVDQSREQFLLDLQKDARFDGHQAKAPLSVLSAQNFE